MQELSHNSVLMASLKSNALTPLCFSPEELRKASKRKPLSANGKDDDDLMRTMTNYPLELQRRTAPRLHTIQALDIAPSPFLQEKLSQSPLAETRGPKSTPKRKLKLHMDASVVVTRNVSLPKLPDTPSPSMPSLSPHPTETGDGEPIEEMQRTHLASSASEPVLSSQSHLKAQDATSLDHADAKRSNIARKLKLYEDIIAGNDFEPRAGRSQRHSQPDIPVWKAAASPVRGVDGNSKSTYSMKKRASHGTVPMSGSLENAFPHNPFAPFYTVKQVIEFGNIITLFDEDLSGDIDQQEWASMLQSFRPIFGQSDHEATEKLFRSIDRDDSGRISLHEILPAMVRTSLLRCFRIPTRCCLATY